MPHKLMYWLAGVLGLLLLAGCAGAATPVPTPASVPPLGSGNAATQSPPDGLLETGDSYGSTYGSNRTGKVSLLRRRGDAVQCQLCPLSWGKGRRRRVGAAAGPPGLRTRPSSQLRLSQRSAKGSAVSPLAVWRYAAGG